MDIVENGMKVCCPKCNRKAHIKPKGLGIVTCVNCKLKLIKYEESNRDSVHPAIPQSFPVQEPEEGIPTWVRKVLPIAAFMFVGLAVIIIDSQRSHQPTTGRAAQKTSGTKVLSEPTTRSAKNLPHILPKVDLEEQLTTNNPTMGDLHKILVPAGYLVGKYGKNMAWKKNDEALYFEVSGSGNGQIKREIIVLTQFLGGVKTWSSRHIKVDSGRIYIRTDDGTWEQIHAGMSHQSSKPNFVAKPSQHKDTIDTFVDREVEKHWRPIPGGNSKKDAKILTRDILKARTWQELQSALEKNDREGR